MRKRDAQSYKVYRSEREAGIGNRNEWTSLEDCEKFLRRVLESKKFPFELTREIKILCRGNRIHAIARREVNHLEIHLPMWARSKEVVLHELAHLVIDARVEWHGERFCDAYLLLLKLFGRRGISEKLRERFLVNRVRFTSDLS